MLGEFLEISIECEDILASIGFYEKLGFVQASTGEAWPHPYAVLTDGRCVIGLHRYSFPSPSLTFVVPGLRERIGAFEALAIDFAFLKLGDNEFNEAGFYDPDGQMICLLEARTYSAPPPPEVTQCGWFEACQLPVREAAASARFWEDLGFVRGVSDTARGGRVSVACGGLTLWLDEDRRLRAPRLVFQQNDLSERLGVLEARDIRPAAVARKPDGGVQSFVLRAPEGTQLLLQDA